MHTIEYRRLVSYSLIVMLTMLLSNLLVSNIPTFKFAYSQPENGTSSTTSTNASRLSNTNTNITVQSTGLSKFQPAPSLPPTSGGAPIVSKIMPEPQNPSGEKYAKVESDRLLSSSRPPSPPTPSPPALENIPGQINTQSLLSSLNVTTASNKTTTNLSNENLSASANNTETAATIPTTSNRTFSLLMDAPRIITTGPSFAGVTQREGRAYPPDVVIAVGSNYVFQAANNVGLVQTRDGGNVTKFRLEPFFNSGFNTIFDPIIVYDNSTKRFFVSVVDSTDGSVRIAVSPQDSVFPLNQWRTFEFTFSNTGTDCPDQAFIAVSSDKLAVGANVFSNNCNGGNYLGTQHVIVNKADLINPSGPADPPRYISPRDIFGFSERPAKGSTTPDMYLAGVYNGNHVASTRVIKYTGTVPNIQRMVKDIPLNLTIDFPPKVPQPGSTKLLENTGRVQAVSISNTDGNLWLTSVEKCKPDGDTDYRSCIRIIKVDPNNNTASNIVLRTKGVYYLYPALALVSNENAVVVFGATSVDLNLYPSLFAISISSSDILGEPVKIQQGGIPAEECYTDDQGNERCRYGDYFGASIDADPLENDTAWITGQYMATKDSWATVMTKVKVQ